MFKNRHNFNLLLKASRQAKFTFYLLITIALTLGLSISLQSVLADIGLRIGGTYGVEFSGDNENIIYGVTPTTGSNGHLIKLETFTAPATWEEMFKVDKNGKVTAASDFCIESGNCLSAVLSSYTETDPQVNSLNSGKWCTSDGSVVNCTSNNPDTTVDGCSNCLAIGSEVSNSISGNLTVNGSVGIGTTEPGEKLDVEAGEIQLDGGYGLDWENDPWGGAGDSAWIRYVQDGSGEDTELQIGVGNDANDNIAFYQSGGERMTIYNGNVGIGMTSPTQKLEVKGTTRITRPTDSGTYLDVTIGNVAATFNGYDSDDGWMNMYFQSNGNTRMTIEGQKGKVGIGTASPDVKLHIYEGNSGGNPDVTYGRIVLEDDTHAKFGFLTPNTVSGAIEFGDPECPYVGQIQYYHYDNTMRFWTNEHERVRIDSNGNVGIGATSQGAKLEVYGTIRTQRYSPGTGESMNQLAKVRIYDNTDCNEASEEGRIIYKNDRNAGELCFCARGNGGTSYHWFCISTADYYWY